MMTTPPSKAENRRQIERHIANFLAEGGDVEQVDKGVSGLSTNAPSHAPLIFDKPPQERTPVPEVVAAIEARRQSGLKKRAAKTKSARRTPRKIAVYDDFGEPLRWVWTE